MDTRSKQKKIILVTGSEGFIGRNLISALNLDDTITIRELTRANNNNIVKICEDVDFVFHLAGENRPSDVQDFQKTNVQFTKNILAALSAQNRAIPILFTSSAQAELDNPYGTSKKEAEDEILTYGHSTNSPTYIFRLPNVFGKWSKPNYNSVVATFCHNLSAGIPLKINEPSRVLDLVHIDDVVDFFAKHLDEKNILSSGFYEVKPVNQITVGTLAATLESFWNSRLSKIIPDLSGTLEKALYGTLTSFYKLSDLSIKPEVFSDDRGWLFELIKSKSSGQIFVSSTNPGYSRGDHWHHTKVEKFTVIKGSGKLLFRNVFSEKIIEYTLSDKQIEIIDVPVGYIHSIQNDTDQEMLLIIWASEILNKEKPDTYYEKVQ
jgi:UDP-2-acetamido-2,6-beta-L-arabino-hexul-4-ose reductase